MQGHVQETQYLTSDKMESLLLSPKLWLGPNSNALHLLFVWQLSVSGPVRPPVYSRHRGYVFENGPAPSPPSNPILVTSLLSDRLRERRFINVWNYIVFITCVHVHAHKHFLLRKQERRERGNELAGATLGVCRMILKMRCVLLRGTAIMRVEIKRFD